MSTLGNQIDKVVSDALSRLDALAPIREGSSAKRIADDVEIYVHQQGWSDTSCGRGGIGGQALTSALCVVVHDSFGAGWLVYHGGGFAYHVERHTDQFITDLKSWNLAGAGQSRRFRYCRNREETT